MLDGDDARTSIGGRADADWNTIVLLDERIGQVILADEIGRGAGSVRVGRDERRPTRWPSASTLLVTSADEAPIVDLADESAQTIELDVGDRRGDHAGGHAR